MKKSGGIHPIAVGNTLRRLTAKIACSRVRDDVSNDLRHIRWVLVFLMEQKQLYTQFEILFYQKIKIQYW